MVISNTKSYGACTSNDWKQIGYGSGAAKGDSTVNRHVLNNFTQLRFYRKPLYQYYISYTIYWDKVYWQNARYWGETLENIYHYTGWYFDKNGIILY